MNIIKECFDNLPMALCFFNRRGIACLVNRRMLWVSTQLLGSSVQTLSELERALKSPPDTVAQLETQPPTYRFSDGSILRFTREVIRDEEGHRYTQAVYSGGGKPAAGGCKRTIAAADGTDAGDRPGGGDPRDENAGS